MKFLTLLVALLTLYTPILNAQDFKFDGDTMTVVFESNLNMEKLHSTVFSAIANIYNSANDVVQMNDTNNGKIIVKGRHNLKMTNFQNKATYSKEVVEMIPEYLDIDVEHTLSIYIKDSKYKLKLVTGQAYSNYMGQRLPIPSTYVYNFDYPSAQDIVNAKKRYTESLSLLYKKRKLEKLIQKEETIEYIESMESNMHTNINEFRGAAKLLALDISAKVINESNQDDDW